MELRLFQVDAFSSERFRGNPAAVMPLDAFLDDATLQAIAAENNLSETAFLVRDGDDYRLRWFTPTVEVPLCGHATLASAAVVMERLEPARASVVFHTRSGPLTARRAAMRYAIDLPARSSRDIEPPAGLLEALGVPARAVRANDHDLLVIVEDAAQVRTLTPDLASIARLPWSGVIVSARGDEGYDVVSRYFAPRDGIPEDPVTGSAHCTLLPYWSGILGKPELRAWQASRRGGEVVCRTRGERVELEGACAFYLEGVAVV
ncbi:MAG: PhzF family phenazine biosynthesis protein [Labilithrix sp.]|nr:PhzF family phenazine biosynthesis protein [Labilithrix sp.]